jgi:hypothetical protein
VGAGIGVWVPVDAGEGLAPGMRLGEAIELGAAVGVDEADDVTLGEPQETAMIAAPTRPANPARILGLPWRPIAVACRARSVQAGPPVMQLLPGATATLRVGPRSGKRHPS